MVSRPTHPCPKCGRTLVQDGEIVLPGGTTVPTFCCDECIVTDQMFGETFELPLMFCLDAAGRPFDPATPDGKIKMDG